MTKERRTYADIIKERREELFVGREEERGAFRRNFDSDMPEYLIFALHGQAGIGKSFLLERYREIARQNGALATKTDEAETTAIREQSILRAMARLARDLAEADAPLKAFDERYQKYRECMQQVEGRIHDLGEDMPGISPNLIKRLKGILLRCGPFANDRELRTVFTDERLHPWRDRVPTADSPAGRVEVIIDFLHNKRSDTQGNALVLLLHVLRDRTDRGDACYGQLARLATDLEHEIKSLVKPAQTLPQQSNVPQMEADPDAPQGIFDLLGRTTARLALGAAQATPAGQAVGGFLQDAGIDEGAFAEQTGAWTAYLAKKLKNKDEIALVKEPVETLTPLFVKDLNELAKERRIVLCFDTWECTGPHLDAWLRNLLKREGLSPKIWLVIAGRNPPGAEWEPFDPVIASFELQTFTEEETRDYLKRQDVTEEARVAQILDFAEGVPVLVSTLASARGSSATAADDLVDRYLKWVDDPRRRETALHCAAARRLDKDVVARVMGGDDVGELFDWLVDMPFVQSRPGYWEYHPTVRKLMLNYTRSRSRRDSQATHGKLRAYYRGLLTEGGKQPRYRDPLWRRYALEALYHGLMQGRAQAEREGLETFLLTLRGYYPLSGEIVAMWLQAAEEQDVANRVTKWADLLSTAWGVIERKQSWDAALPFCEATREREDLSDLARSEVYFTGGYAYSKLQDYERAIADFDQAIELNPEYAAAHSNRGGAYYELQNYERAIADYDRAIELNPKYALAYFNRGNAYYELQDYEWAIADYDRAIELNPESATVYNNRGNAYAHLQKYERAVGDYGRATVLNPEDATAYNNRGLAYHDLQDYKRAIEEYDRAIKLNPELTQAYNNRGNTYSALQEYERAIEDYDRAITLNPELAATYYNRGLTYYALQEYERAIEDFDRAIALNPGLVQARHNRGNAYYALQRYKRAIEDYDRAVALAPEDAETYNNLGNAYYALQDYDRAIEFYNRAIALNPKFVQAYHNRGNAYAALRKYKRAIEDYDQAVALDPECAQAYYSTARVYVLTERAKLACEWLGKAINLDEECRETAQSDKGFDPIRHHPTFQSLVGNDNHK